MEIPVGNVSQANVEPPRFSERRINEFLLDKNWWRAAWKKAWLFAPRCTACAMALTVGNLIIVFGSQQMQIRMHLLQSAEGITSIEPIVQILLIGLTVMALSLLLTLWSLSVWMVQLTIFANAVQNAGTIITREIFSESASVIRKRKKFFAKVWLVASLYLLIPIFPIALMIALKAVTGPEFTVGGQALVPVPSVLNQDNLQVAITIFGAALSVLALAYSMTTLVFSSVSTAGPGSTANAALSECFKHSGMVLVVAVAVTVLNMIVTAPSLALTMMNLPSLPGSNVWLACLGQIWIGISSVVLWPLSVAPFCELVRSSSEEPSHA